MLPQYEHKLSQQSLKALQAVVQMGVRAQRLGVELARILEAVQLLEHAELVCASGRTEQNDYWTATPTGPRARLRRRSQLQRRQDLSSHSLRLSSLDLSRYGAKPNS